MVYIVVFYEQKIQAFTAYKPTDYSWSDDKRQRQYYDAGLMVTVYGSSFSCRDALLWLRDR